MRSELRPYPKYRDSGLAWLGNIPAHWDLLRTKFLFREIDDRSKAGEETHLSMSQKHGLVESSRIENLPLQSENYAGGKLCKTNDLVLNRLKAHLGVFSHASQDGVVSSDYTVLRLRGDDQVRYFEFLFKTPNYISELRRSARGIVEGFWRLYTDDFYNIRSIVPPVSEQQSILKWIDWFDSLLSDFVRNRRQLIKLLKEERQALVTRLVTIGLNPNARFKSSGIDCIGEMPAHWKLLRLRNVAELRVSNVDKNTVDGEVPIRLCNYVDVYRNERITNRISFMPATATAEEVERFRLKHHDVIITKDSEEWSDIGVPALVEYTAGDLVCGYHLALLRPRNGVIDGSYLLRALQSQSVAYQFQISANGVTRYGLSHDAIKSVFIPVPPLDEQERLVRAIEEETEELDSAIDRITKQIDLIRDFRSLLITDVVMGKVDVRDTVPYDQKYLHAQVPLDIGTPVGLSQKVADQEVVEGDLDADG